MNSFPLDRLLFPEKRHSDIKAESLSELWGLVPSALKRHFLQTLKMEQDPPSCHLIGVISQITCIISSAYKGNLQLIHVIMI